MFLQLNVYLKNLKKVKEKLNKFTEALTETEKVELPKFASMDTTIKGFDVELYVQDVKEQNASMGIYSLLHDKWIKHPNHVDAEIDDASVQAKFKHIAKQIDNGISKGAGKQSHVKNGP